MENMHFPKSTYNFCTLFDQHYLYRGIAMYHSLDKNLANFQLWILCMDELTYKILSGLTLSKVHLIKLADLEDAKLLKAKSNRNSMEYCWTLTPCLPSYVLEKNPELDHITYIDADLYFFASPALIFSELTAEKNILITSHNYFPEYRFVEAGFGKYNVQFLIFKNNQFGREALAWWKERCLEWCYARAEDNKFGDQKYLDDWETRFTGVQVMQTPGAGIAPWNILNYQLTRKAGKLYVSSQELIFYHFHALKLHHPYFMRPIGHYQLTHKIRCLIYRPYFKALRASIKSIKQGAPDFNSGWTKFNFLDYLGEKKLAGLKRLIKLKQHYVK